MKMPSLTRVVGGKRYSTEGATLLAHDVWWDGHNMERQGRNTWLLRTPNGRYFTVTGTLWQGERDSLEPLSEEAASQLYESLPVHEMEWEEAFQRTLEEA